MGIADVGGGGLHLPEPRQLGRRGHRVLVEPKLPVGPVAVGGAVILLHPRRRFNSDGEDASSRRREFCHSADAPSACLLQRLLYFTDILSPSIPILERLLKGEGGAAEWQNSRRRLLASSPSLLKRLLKGEGGAAEWQNSRRRLGGPQLLGHAQRLREEKLGARVVLARRLQPSARLLSFCGHPLSIAIETPTEGRGGCSRMTSLADGAGPPRRRSASRSSSPNA